MLNVGIITMLNDSTNAGGVLQAYALCRWINATGNSCKQILYDPTPKLTNCSSSSDVLFCLKSSIKSMIEHVKFIESYRLLKTRKLSFSEYVKNSIPITDIKYDSKTIKRSNDEFDLFIAGGDQIWNNYSDAYMLTFANKVKASYAVSLTNMPIDRSSKDKYIKSLSSLSRIAIREDETANYLSSLLNTRVESVVDPVFLLSVDEWGEVATERLVNEEYIFVYLLGFDPVQIKYIKDQATMNGMKCVTIAMASAILQDEDLSFADVVVDMRNPNDFLSLIKNAAFIYTDSFHAMAFSIIFNKGFKIFERTNRPQMSVRVSTLAALTATEGYVLSRKALTRSIEHNDLDEICDYNKEKLEIRILESKQYLSEILGMDRDC